MHKCPKGDVLNVFSGFEMWGKQLLCGFTLRYNPGSDVLREEKAALLLLER